MALNYGVTGVAFVALVIIWLAVTLPNLELVPFLAASLGVTVAVPILFFPFSKTIWVAVDLLLHLDTKDPESIARTFGVDPSGPHRTP
jgi:hypothetical protein